MIAVAMSNYAREKGHAYERQIIKELTELGYKGLKSSRSESRNLDDDKIDIAETSGHLPCYIQVDYEHSLLFQNRGGMFP